MNSQIHSQGATEHPSQKRLEESQNQEKVEPEPERHLSKKENPLHQSSALHSKELLRQRNIFWAFTSLSTMALISIFYLVRLLTI